MIRIGENGSISACESYLAQIAQDPAPLLLAERLSYAAFGGSAALAQVMCTWARRSPDAELFPQFDAHRTFHDLAMRPHGLTAILMARAITGPHREDWRRAAYEAAARVSFAMDQSRFVETTKGNAVALLCADHSSLGYLTPFYAQGPQGAVLRTEVEFQQLASDVLRASVNQARADEVARYAGDVGVMMRELIDNTHRYARRDARGNQYRKSIRGLHAQTHQVEPGDIPTLTGDYAPLAGYLQGITGRFRSKHTQVLEISIFDSGPGLAARALGTELQAETPIGDEQRLVQSRFHDPKLRYGRDGAGKGLRRTVRRLKSDGGFLRLRTGRTSFYKDFHTASDAPLEPADLQLLDAASATHVATEMAKAEGTLLTLLIPLFGGRR
ncbi:hypothetical protein [Sphingomonas oryzagri]|uniref:Sensor histidine kinase n=1 Tax=Sphingomonas oryzagri TaxID=3042314 RepID=A0ABT6MYG9_9SPHN|nr:hypothetical protein [Sphingomonas oryzagri]MDH7638101.1 hypothetical protein [Sphingomonas oryzagri]